MLHSNKPTKTFAHITIRAEGGGLGFTFIQTDNRTVFQMETVFGFDKRLLSLASVLGCFLVFILADSLSFQCLVDSIG
ncbi:hypothetical protein BWD09_07885 [Neisseria dentiae]|uniref:Uncharacterized protein n=1 Tax=Neisseria dentiae TaxID=194197 RepID=A0A1X3D8J3_9NEIS|nr:hypothetical protein BWD09_07885 [Neisseria dentiae]